MGEVDASVHERVRRHCRVRSRRTLWPDPGEAGTGGREVSTPKPPKMPSQPAFHMPSQPQFHMPTPPREQQIATTHSHNNLNPKAINPKATNNLPLSGGTAGSANNLVAPAVVPFHVSQRGFYNHYHNSYRRRLYPNQYRNNTQLSAQMKHLINLKADLDTLGAGGVVADPETERPAPSRSAGGGGKRRHQTGHRAGRTALQHAGRCRFPEAEKAP